MLSRLELIPFNVVFDMGEELERMITRPRQSLVMFSR